MFVFNSTRALQEYVLSHTPAIILEASGFQIENLLYFAFEHPIRAIQKTGHLVFSAGEYLDLTNLVEQQIKELGLHTTAHDLCAERAMVTYANGIWRTKFDFAYFIALEEAALDQEFAAMDAYALDNSLESGSMQLGGEGGFTLCW
ncbi:hypothetical protein KAZ57_00985 [Patescibacteria group bacterium]|nr:hypothetical protein [Patescibacteria group bacterium]